MKNLIITLCLFASFQANSQTIAHSSISCMQNQVSVESYTLSHFISKMNLASVNQPEAATAINHNANSDFGTLSAYPNPAVSNIHFVYELTGAGKVNVSIYNEMGQKVMDVSEDSYNGGKNMQEIDLTSFSSGMYFLALNFTSNSDQQTHTITKKFQVNS